MVVVKLSKKNIAKITIGIISFIFVTVNSLNLSALTREEKILNRIKPMGSITLTEGAKLATTAKPTLGKDAGVKRYKSSCYICHDTGASGAPKLGDKAAWSARLKQGTQTLYDHSIHGYNAMPAKGGCINCSDKEIELTVDYMLDKSR